MIGTCLLDSVFCFITLIHWPINSSTPIPPYKDWSKSIVTKCIGLIIALCQIFKRSFVKTKILCYFSYYFQILQDVVFDYCNAFFFILIMLKLQIMSLDLINIPKFIVKNLTYTGIAHICLPEKYFQNLALYLKNKDLKYLQAILYFLINCYQKSIHF